MSKKRCQRGYAQSTCAALLLLGGVLANMASAATPAAPQKWALLVGVDRYASLKQLKYSGADQRDLAAQLVASGFPEDQVILLHDDAEENKFRPFRANINQQLELLLDDQHGLAKQDDLVIVGFSGHGVSIDGKSYLCPLEAKLDDAVGTMLPVEDLYKRLEKCRASLKLLMVDACRNDPEVEGRRSARSARAATDFAASLRRPPRGLMLFNSCGEGQAAMEEEDFGHGVFMHFVLEGLRGQAANREGTITLTGLYDYASLKTEKYVARKFSAFQTPALEGKIDGNFELCRIDPVRPNVPEERTYKPGSTINNSIGLKLTLIPAGEFLMGSEESAAELEEAYGKLRDDFTCTDEQPVHRVRITRDFWMGTFEVSLAQFRAFVEATQYQTEAESSGEGSYGYDSTAKDILPRVEFNWKKWGAKQSDTSPVVNVSWNDAAAFCEWLSKQEEATYRLPTEAEWEYACRAGTNTRFYNGDEVASVVRVGNVWDQSLFDLIGPMNHLDTTILITPVPARDGFPLTSPAGRFRSNAFGLYDTIGNVAEWCSDWYDPDYYAQSPEEDPQGPEEGTQCLIRGGGWYAYPVYTRAAFRFAADLNYRRPHIGFRVVREQ